MVFLACLSAGMGELYAQRISIGAEAGVPLTESFDTGFIYRGTFVPATSRYTVGPALELRLNGRFSAEFSALYQPFSFQESGIIGVPSSRKTTGGLWQFPVLLRYSFFEGPIRPFVAVGPSFQAAAKITASDMTVVDPTPVISHPEPTRRAIAGVAAGGGLQFSIGRLRISPELRYTRWGVENFDFTQTNHVGTKLNQFQVLVAVMF
jgi:hypothetical protein